MKLLLCVFVLTYGFYRTVYGAKTPVRVKEIFSLEAEPVIYGDGKNFIEEGAHKKISCKGSHRSQKIDWYDPSGEVVKHEPSGRVYAQEHFAPSSLKTRSQALVLVFTHALVKDSGVWECRSGDLVETVPLCILDPAEFVETPEEITVDEGRSITLTCQSRGDPEPKIQWYKDGELLSEESHKKMYTSTKYNHHGFEGLLTIKALTAKDSGSYVCETVQEVPDVDDCSHTNSVNITLNVNFSPRFETDLITTFIFSQYNESVEFICAPNAYPKPKFRWFRDIGDMLTEYSDKQFKVSDDGTQSILSLVANSSTFGQKFTCTARNVYGKASNNYQLFEMTKPAKISELTIVNVTDSLVEFNVTWDSEVDLFPVDAFEIQYLQRTSSGSPKESQWKRAEHANFVLTTSIFELDDIIVPLSDLEEATDYWVRIRAVNELGEGPWSSPIFASTVSELEQLFLPMDSESDYGMFYGIFFAGLIVIIAAVCIFIVKRV